jgi:O-antigen ligase
VALALARGLLIVLALVLPFEAPLVRVWVLQLTSVEIALYAMTGAWAVAVAWEVIRARSLAGLASLLRGDPVARAAALWAVVLVASALAAPSYRGAAMKFALRSLSGILVFFAARTLARTEATSRRVLMAVLAGGLVSAATALVERWIPYAEVWSIFRGSTFEAFGLGRASGVFAYPTIAAMYWEACLPIAVVLPLVAAGDRLRGWRAVAVAVALSIPLDAALVASGTRSGMAGAAVALAGLVALGWRSEVAASDRPRSLRRAGAAVLFGLALTSALGLGGTGSASLVGQRLRWWQDDQWFRVQYDVGAAPATVHAGEVFTVPVRLRNTGSLAWQRSGPRPFRLAYHWEPVDRPATAADFEGQRTDLPVDVPPGGAVDLIAAVRGPSWAGTYHLRWDLVEEHVTWFGERGNPMPAQAVVVEEHADGVPPPQVSEADTAPAPPAAATPPGRLALWKAALSLWKGRPLLGIGPDNFRRRYPEVIGLDAAGRPYADTRIHANNFYMETLADLGLVGAAALAWIAVAFVRSLRVLSRPRGSGQPTGLGSGLAAGAFFVHGLFDYFLEFTPLFCLFWMLLGLTAARAQALRTGGPPGSQG